MKELIKYFNDNYGSKYGNIDYPRTNKQIYSTYQIIKEFGVDDEKLDKLLKEVELPNPKTIEERDMHSECKASITKDDVLDMLPCYDIEKVVFSYTKEELDKLERVSAYGYEFNHFGYHPFLKIPKFDLDNTFFKIVLSCNGEIITDERKIDISQAEVNRGLVRTSFENGVVFVSEKIDEDINAVLNYEYFEKYYAICLERMTISKDNEDYSLNFDNIVSFTVYKKEKKTLDKKFIQSTRNLILLTFNLNKQKYNQLIKIQHNDLSEYFRKGGYLHILIKKDSQGGTQDVLIPIGESILPPKTNMYYPDIIEGHYFGTIVDFYYYNPDFQKVNLFVKGTKYLDNNTAGISYDFIKEDLTDIPATEINFDVIGVYYEECEFPPCLQ